MSERHATFGDIKPGDWIYVDRPGATGWWLVEAAAIRSANTELRLHDFRAEPGTGSVLSRPTFDPVRIRDRADIPPLSELGSGAPTSTGEAMIAEVQELARRRATDRLQ